MKSYIGGKNSISPQGSRTRGLLFRKLNSQTPGFIIFEWWGRVIGSGYY